MNDAMLILALIVGIIVIDAASVAYGIHIGMKYPFLAAAAVNTGIVILANLTGIIWMLTRS